MKYVITKEQRFFFEKNYFIEFDDLLSEQQLQMLVQRLGKKMHLSSQELFLQGRDICRQESAIMECLSSPRLAHIAAQLAGVTRLRFGFDQLYKSEIASTCPSFSKLNEESSIRGLVCALMICLSGEQTTAQRHSYETGKNSGIDPFPSKKGSGIFFLPSTLCDPQAIQAHSGQLFLLFTWAHDRSLYVFEPRDPHTHALKKLGLVFGDRLVEKWHPTILREGYGPSA